MSLRILYWNVWCLPFFATDGVHSKDRAEAIAPILRGYDVVILNEAWTDAAKKVFKREYTYSYQTSKMCGKLLDSGLLILSNHLIHNPSHILYSDAAGWDWFTSKGALHFQIRTTSDISIRRLQDKKKYKRWSKPKILKTYDIFTTHMQAGYSTKDHDARRIQLRELTRFVNSKTRFVNSKLPGAENVFLIGDFNVMPMLGDAPYPNCHDIIDARRRSLEYHKIHNQTGLVDLNLHNIQDVYHVFSNSDPDRVDITYHDSTLADGPYLTIDVTIA